MFFPQHFFFQRAALWKCPQAACIRAVFEATCGLLQPTVSRPHSGLPGVGRVVLCILGGGPHNKRRVVHNTVMRRSGEVKHHSAAMDTDWLIDVGRVAQQIIDTAPPARLASWTSANPSKQLLQSGCASNLDWLKDHGGEGGGTSNHGRCLIEPSSAEHDNPIFGIDGLD